MKKLLLILISASLLLPLSSCSSGSSSSTQTVFAQTAYSNASLDGTYSISFTCQSCNFTTGTTSYGEFAIGTIQMNGAGGITGGTLSASGGNNVNPSCVESVSGTYSLQSTALGTATLSLSSTSSGCNATATLPLSLAAAGQGTSILFQGTTPPDALNSGIAIKQ